MICQLEQVEQVAWLAELVEVEGGGRILMRSLQPLHVGPLHHEGHGDGLHARGAGGGCVLGAGEVRVCDEWCVMSDGD